MSMLRSAVAILAVATGMSLQTAGAQTPQNNTAPAELPSVTVVAPALVAKCDGGSLSSLPELDNSLARHFGLTACFKDGVDFGKVFTDDRTRMNKINQLFAAAQTLAQRREIGQEVESGEVMPGFWVAREPGGSYRFEWTTSRPTATVTADNALPGDQVMGDNTMTTLSGIIRPAAPRVKPAFTSTLR